MALTNPRTLRTIHNGSNGVAKAYVVVPAGGDLMVTDELAAQLQRDPAFKDGPAPQSLIDALNPPDDVTPEAVVEVAPVAPRPAKKAPAKG